MALNYSHRSMFPAPAQEDKDIRELLPADPFEMDISSTVNAITGWLEDLGADYGSCRGRGEVVGGCKGDYPLFTGFNFWWNRSPVEFQNFPVNKNFDDRMMKDSQVDSFFPEEGLRCSVIERDVGFSCSMDGVKFGNAGEFDKFHDHWKISGVDGYLSEAGFEHLVYDGGVSYPSPTANASFDRGDDSITGVAADIDVGVCDCYPCATNNASFDRGDDNFTGVAADSDDIIGAPHPALSYALAYLGVRDLLSVERVCKSLCYTVQNDPLLWRSIHIDERHNSKQHIPITDDVLLQLTNRAQGSLHCLSLVHCLSVTDDGIRRVLLSNRRLTRLSIPDCTRVNIDGLMNCLRDFKMVAVYGIKYIRVGGLNVTQKHFEELVALLDISNQSQNNCHKPHFSHRRYFDLDDDRPIDIEMCPRCQTGTLVFDCPAESCQGKDHSSQLCRACIPCISRCLHCGKCVNDREYEETFLLDLQCSDCSMPVLQCQERQDV